MWNIMKSTVIANVYAAVMLVYFYIKLVIFNVHAHWHGIWGGERMGMEMTMPPGESLVHLRGCCGRPSMVTAVVGEG